MTTDLEDALESRGPATREAALLATLCSLPNDGKVIEDARSYN